MSMIPETTVTVTAQTAYQANPELSIPFRPDEIVIIATGAAGVIVHFSFDGISDHGQVTVGTSEVISRWITHCAKVWFRRDAATAGTATVRVQAQTYQ